MGLTVANVLTILRMVCIPFFIMAVGYNRTAWAFGLFVAAGITDLLDGLIARVWKQQTRVGAILDPMADKLLLTAAFVMLALPDGTKAFPGLVLHNRIPIFLVIITISRDVFISLISLVMYMTLGQTRFPPSLLGKLTTTIQILTVAVILLFNWLGRESVVPVQIMIWSCLALSVSSGFHYIYLATCLANQEPPP
ncbi:MAG TPA: CDP-alcohol phosphatidyltransferase family protein [Candidatus Polarisedimenticolia bacterium]|nr:CDP-alcohol phosphatidyltransferase family protein [Candidatus Polarisedimenticolia bacterium]